MNPRTNIPPHSANRFLHWFLRDDLAEDVQGDLEEQFIDNLERYSPFRAKAKYWIQVINYLRPFAVKGIKETQINNMPMFKNYLKIGWRNLIRNLGFSLINIFGLAFGLTCTIFILLWVQNELSWDKFHKNIDNIYRVYLNRPGDNGVFTQSALPLALWDALKSVAGTRYVSPTNTGGTVVLSNGEVHLEKKFLNAGDDFLKIFDFNLLEGSPDRQMTDASSIVITRSTAHALFGDQDALGKVINIDHHADLTISGIVDDPPANSTIQFDCLIPFAVLFSLNPEDKDYLNAWGRASWYVYVALEPGADPRAYEAKIKNLINTHTDRSDQNLMLFPFKKVHLYSKFENGKSVGGDITYVKIFTLIAIMILALAYINFVNLSTARSEKRSKEVGIRKTIGSSRTQLVFQFLSETMLVTIIAFIMAVIFVIALLPAFNSLVHKNLQINYHSLYIWIAAAGFILLTGIVSGGYPAFFLSSFKPVAVFKKKLVLGKRSGLPRKIMLTTQFFFSIGLIISTVIIISQVHYARQLDTGYDKDRLVMVPVNGTIMQHYESICNELQDWSIASSVTLTSSPVTDLWNWSKPEWDGQREDQKTFFGIVGTGFNYENTLHAKITSGRGFDPAYNDSSSALLNQSAVDYMQLKNPVGKIIYLGGKTYTVVGVMGNLVMGSPFDPAYRTIFLYKPKWASYLVIRIKDNQGMQAGLKGIESVFKTYNPSFPFSYSFVDEEFDKKFTDQELIEKLANIFSLLAIVISSLGLLGLSAYAAEQRTKEVGIRIIFGASLSQILALFSMEFNRLVIFAFLLAAPLTWWIMNRWLKTFTIHISISWWMLGFAGLFALLLTWMIVGLQVFKTALANPVETLRSE